MVSKVPSKLTINLWQSIKDYKAIFLPVELEILIKNIE